MPVKCYQDLVVWQKAMRLAREAYLIAKKLPYEEKFALSDQLRRSQQFRFPRIHDISD